MSNLARASVGASCDSASCYDVSYPPTSVIDGNPSTYWMTTGMFPHELVIKLGTSSTVRRLQISGMNLGVVTASRTSGPAPGSWNELCTLEMPGVANTAQTEASDCAAGEATFVRLQFRSGIDAFAAVYSVDIFS